MRWILVLLLFSGCVQSQWVEMNTPLDGSRSGVIQFKGESDHQDALLKAREFCGARLMVVTQVSNGFTGYSGLSLDGIGYQKANHRNFLHFVCLTKEVAK